MKLVWPALEYLPGFVDALERGWSPDTADLLRKMGHTVETGASGVSNVHGILVEAGWLQGAPDGRSNGKAAGY